MISAPRHLVDDAVRGSRRPAAELALGDPWGDGSIRFADLAADESASRLTLDLRRTLFDELDLGAVIVPTLWDGARPSPRSLVRELRPLFRRDPATGVEVGALPVLATAGAWAYPAGADLARELLAGRPLALALGPSEVALTRACDSARAAPARAAPARADSARADSARGGSGTSGAVGGAARLGGSGPDDSGLRGLGSGDAGPRSGPVDSGLGDFGTGDSRPGSGPRGLGLGDSGTGDVAPGDSGTGDSRPHSGPGDSDQRDSGPRGIDPSSGTGESAFVGSGPGPEPRLSGRLPLVAVPAGARLVAVRAAGRVFLVDLDAGGRVSRGATRTTTGLRGILFASFELQEAPVLASWPVDAEADAEAAAIVAALWAGTVDTALRLAVPYAQGRGLYGGSVWDIPHARSLIADACTDLLIADAVALAVLDGAPADALELVPTLLSEAMRSLSVLFGSSFYARVEPYAVFETLLRDVASMRLLSIGGPDADSSTNAPGTVAPSTVVTSGAVATSDTVAEATAAGVRPGESARAAGEFVPRMDAVVEAAARAGDARLASRLVAAGVAGVRHPSDVPLWQAMAIVVDTRERGVTSTWRRAALTRLEMRLTRRRGVLGDDAIEPLASHVARCADQGISVTFDTVGVFASREQDEEESA